jgi:hypothetical protein
VSQYEKTLVLKQNKTDFPQKTSIRPLSGTPIFWHELCKTPAFSKMDLKFTS